MRAGSQSGESSQWRSRRAPIGVSGAVERSSSVAPSRAGAQRLHQLEVAAGHLVEPEVRVAAPHGRAREVRQAGGLELARGSGAARPRRRRRRRRPGRRPSPSSDASRSGGRGRRAPARRRTPSAPAPVREEPVPRARACASRRAATSSRGASRASASASPSRVERLQEELAGGEVDRGEARRRRPPAHVRPRRASCCVRRRASRPASSAPGVTVSTTSRRTMPLASFGSSTCSQMATRWPAATSWRR